MNVEKFVDAIKSCVEAVNELLKAMAQKFGELVSSLTEGTVYEYQYGRSSGKKVVTHITQQAGDVANDISRPQTLANQAPSYNCNQKI